MHLSVIISGSLAGLAIALAPTVSHAQDNTRYMVCVTKDFEHRKAYASEIFAITMNEYVKANPAWNAVMTSKYGVSALPSVSCQDGYSPAQAKGIRDRFAQSLPPAWHASVVDVKWTYNSAPAIAVADSTPAAPTAPAHPAAPASLTAEQRQAAEKEVENSKGYCEHNMRELRTLVGCDCFAQAVLHHRLAHPEEKVTSPGEPPYPPPVPTLVGGMPFKLDCTECLTDQRMTAYVQELLQSTYNIRGALSIPQAKLDAITSCTTKAFIPKMRANPYLHLARKEYDEAYIPCANQS